MAYRDVQFTIPPNFLQGSLDPGQDWAGQPLANMTRLPLLPSVRFSFWPGTGSQLGKIDRLILKDGYPTPLTNVTPGTTDRVDFDLSTITDAYNVPAGMAEACDLAVLNYATTDGFNLILGGSAAAGATNPWTAIFSAMTTPANGRLTIPPGYIDPLTTAIIPGGVILWSGNLAALPVTPTSKILRLYTASASVPYVIQLSGRSVAA